MIRIITWVRKNFILSIILFVAAVLRFYHIDFQSVWLDEIHTMVEVSPSISYKEFYDIAVEREVMPHLYFLIARFFTFIIDGSVLVVRSISAVAGILSVFTIYLLGKELISKKAGIFASLFLAVNEFHIFYSQEARPYALFSLLTILSFLFLLRFTKKINLKSGLYYAFFAALMINTHFFGLFVLVSQAILLLIHLITVKSKFKKLFFINSLITGVIVILTFIPSLPILIKASNRKTFWLKSNDPEFIAELFSKFFGRSELLIYTALLLVIAYFIKIFLQKEKHIIKTNNKYLASFTLLMVWLFIIIIIPYIRSYTNHPMLIKRYFMSALPAIILIIAIGLSSIKSRAVVIIIGSIFVFSSFINLILVNKYYVKVSKTQFREITEEVNLKNVDKNPIVYRMAWHMEYFFNKNEIKLVHSNLDNYVDKIKRKNKLENFWAMGAHRNPYKVKPKTQAFLDKNFYLIDEINYYDTWAKYYIYKNNNQITKLDLVDFTPDFSLKNSVILIKSNSTITSKAVNLQKGKYRLSVKSKSSPKKSINNENAHLDVAINGKRLGGFYTSAKKIETTIFEFDLKENTDVTVEFTFGNDYFTHKGDRDLSIYGASIEKLKE
jgi:hypothetical protein